MIVRLVWSAIVVLIWGTINVIQSVPATIVTGQVAGHQFDNSDASYAISQGVMQFFTVTNWFLTLIFVLLLIGIWRTPIKKMIATIVAGFSVALMLGLITKPADAYYDKTDYAEAYFILPNESAFWIPDVGANKDSQAQFGSEEYFRANKIPAKRFVIPHTKFSGSGSWLADYYVPAGRLIVVDRTPYSREWVAATDRGTSSKNEGFKCQSKEGLDITVGIAIGASVTEDNAAKFLYHFGVNAPQGDRSQPQVIFTSVYYGRSLAQVMDVTIRNKIQSLICNEFTTRSLDDGNAQAKQIMTTVEAAATTYLANDGITLDYIGWADTFEFNEDVQKAINRRYIAAQDAAIADMMSTRIQTTQALAAAEATRTLSGKWNGATPTSVSLWWLPSSLTDWLTGMGKKDNTDKAGK